MFALHSINGYCHGKGMLYECDQTLVWHPPEATKRVWDQVS
jgi:hypothetical protein